jgi:prepilin-type processing-associated H-X9-DG protein
MNPFPNEWELLALFECEPVILDPNVPWAYNHLTFTSQRGQDSIVCVIEPGYSVVNFTWRYWRDVRVHLDLHWVQGIVIETGGGRDAMNLTFLDGHLRPLTLQLKPHISCIWGTNTEMP